MGKSNMDRGIVTVSDTAVKQIAAYFIKNCTGFAEMTDKTKKRIIIGRSDTSGIYVKNTREGVVIDAYFACLYGADPTALAKEAQDKVFNAYEGTGIKISKVNIHINSVK